MESWKWSPTVAASAVSSPDSWKLWQGVEQVSRCNAVHVCNEQVIEMFSVDVAYSRHTFDRFPFHLLTLG